MDVSNRAKRTFWISWIFIFPLCMWLMYTNSTPMLNWKEIDIISFLLLTVIIAVLPIIVNDTTILFTEGVTLAIFLYFGLFMEVIISQIGMFILLAKIRIGKHGLYRLPLNSLLFLAISLGGAAVYFALGGTIGRIDTSNPNFLLPIVGYVVSKFYLNHMLLRLIKKKLHGIKEPFITRDFLWEAATTLLHIPVGLVLYMLYIEVGLIALFYVGIPLLSLSIILRMYYSSQLINFYLQKASEIGHQLAEKLAVDEVLDLFIEKISNMLPVDYAYILDVVDDKELHVIRYFSKEKGREKEIRPLMYDEGIAGRVWSTKKAVLFHTKKDFKSITKGYLADTVESAICVPVMRHGKVVAIIALASNRKRTYEKYQLTIVDILASYLAVSVENARHHEETKNKSERCPLTGLYNYRYFEQVLEKEYSKLAEKDKGPLSLMLIDIDHFKKINDTYGHQSGNDILCELANRLIYLIGDTGTVARYGGEEFVILLPETDKKSCFQLAETVRQMIANRPFTAINDLATYQKKVLVQITASIGFATAPTDASSSFDLIRHADRAMYTGAKQAGRNRVAEYVK